MREDTLLIADVSDVSKKYAKKVDHLAGARDGSEDKISEGYWTVRVIGAEVDSVKIVPLYEHLYSQNAPDFISENQEVPRAVECGRNCSSGQAFEVRGTRCYLNLFPLS